MGEVKDKSFTLGAPAAERDASLQHCFVHSDIYDSILSGNCKVLIGNRGSGKSALLEMYASNCIRNRVAVLKILPEDYSYEMLGEALRSELDGSWAKQGSYTASWKFVLLSKAMMEARDRFPNARDPSYRKIHSFLRANFADQNIDIFDTLLSYMKRFEGIKLGDIEIGLKTKELKRLYKLEEMLDLLEHFRSIVASQRIVILIDELDRGWDASEGELSG